LAATFCAPQTLHAEVFTINDALKEAVRSHPGVGEAAANRRATESELRQTQSTLLPQVKGELRVGPEKFNQNTLPPTGNDDWRYGQKATFTVRQLLFDGFASINDIWRQAARVDAAASRVRERTELIALGAAEAYIDVVRYTRLVGLAQQNVAAHRKILANVQARFSGGRAGEGDLQQTRERVESAQAAYADFKRSLDEARGKYRAAVGLEPYNLRFPGRLRGLPSSKDESLAVALRHNPTLMAAESDTKAAKYAFKQTAGAFVPNAVLEGTATFGKDYDTFIGRRDELTGKLVVTWDIFRGGQDSWRRKEMADRYIEQSMRYARLQRVAFESLDKAWAGRTITGERIAALIRQIDSDRKVIEAYSKEYELGQRSLIDLLNAQNQLFNASVSLASTRGVAVFADYQLLAAMGTLLAYVKEPPPIESAPLDPPPFAIFPIKLPPVLLRLPKTGPEPLNASPENAPRLPNAASAPAAAPKVAALTDEKSAPAEAPKVVTVTDDSVVPPQPPKVITFSDDADAPAKPPKVISFKDMWSDPQRASTGAALRAEPATRSAQTQATTEALAFVDTRWPASAHAPTSSNPDYPPWPIKSGKPNWLGALFDFGLSRREAP
jgi:adhesin transport system outer membrane protein